MPRDIRRALDDFAPFAKKLPVAGHLDGAMPVITPHIAEVKCVACVYAPPHKDLPFPRFSVLAAIDVQPDTHLFVRDNAGKVHSAPLHKGDIVVLDAHLEHWVPKPSDFPSDWDSLSEQEQNRYKSTRLSVFANIDFANYPSEKDCATSFRKKLHLA